MLQKTDVPPQAVREFIAEGYRKWDDLLIVSDNLVPSNNDQAQVSSYAPRQCYRPNLPDRVDYPDAQKGTTPGRARR